MVKTSYCIECSEATSKRLLAALDTQHSEKGIIRFLRGRTINRNLCGKIDDYHLLPEFTKRNPGRTICVIRINTTEGLNISDFRFVLREVFEKEKDFDVYFLSKNSSKSSYVTNDAERLYFDALYDVKYNVAGRVEKNTFSSEMDLRETLISLMRYPLDDRAYISRGTIEQWNKDHEATGQYIRVIEYKVVEK